MDQQPPIEPTRRRVPSTVAIGIAAALGGLAIGITGVASAASSPAPTPSTNVPGGTYGGPGRHCHHGAVGGSGGDTAPTPTTAPTTTGSSPTV